MPRRAQALLTGEKIPVPEEPSRMERRARVGIGRHTGRSGEETLIEEPDRIANYLRTPDFEKAGKIIYNKTTSNIAMDSLLKDPNFANLFANVSDEVINSFKAHITERFGLDNVRRIQRRRITSLTGKRIRGEHIIKGEIYAQVVSIMRHRQIQFRSYATGRLVSIKGLRKALL